MKRRTVHRVCTLREATCGLAIEVEGRRVLAICGDVDDPFSRGHMCAKAPALADLHEDPDRLRRPVKRMNGGFVEISWEEAFGLAAEGLLAARAQGGANAIALYRGNPSIHDLGSTLYYIVLLRAVGTQNRFSAGSLDTWPRCSMNSWLHNSERLLRGRERCTLQVHPDDARRLGLRDGDAARLSTEAGELVAPVELSDRLMPGVVSLPHGWGHDLPGVGLGVASRRPGVNTNRLLAARDVDAPSGASVLNGVPVTVEAAGATP